MPGRIFRGLAIALGLVFTAASARADLATFELTYVGVFGSTATGSATITLDPSQLNNPGFTTQDTNPFVTDFSITIAGASSGNGTFGFADFNGAFFGGFEFDTNGGTLDFTQELIGQPTSGNPFGSSFFSGSNGGDFTIFSTGYDPAAPNDIDNFIIGTNGGSGDLLLLTSFAPVSSVPEPASLTLVGLGLTGLISRMVRERRRRPARA